MEMPIMHDNHRLEFIRDIGWGYFGVARLMRDKCTHDLVAIKYIPRGTKIDANVEREIMNHRSLRHPNIVRFKEARYFFQQLISGVSYCHSMQICHRDLKLENLLLDGPALRLKICDFGYSKSSLLHSQPNSRVGTPVYIAPEVMVRKEYDGKIADVWSCGVALYVMLVGSYPFDDPENPKDVQKTIMRIINVQYSVPKHLRISKECLDLISRIFVADPAKRISIREIKKHAWFQENLGEDVKEETKQAEQPMQSLETIMRIISDASIPPVGLYDDDFTTDNDIEEEEEEDMDIDSDFDAN